MNTKSVCTNAQQHNSWIESTQVMLLVISGGEMKERFDLISTYPLALALNVVLKRGGA